MAVYRADLVCEVEGLHYDFEKKVGRLLMAETSACDLGGCVALFTKIDPDVKLIETFAGDKSDTIFKRSNDGWKAVLTR